MIGFIIGKSNYFWILTTIKLGKLQMKLLQIYICVLIYNHDSNNNLIHKRNVYAKISKRIRHFMWVTAVYFGELGKA